MSETRPLPWNYPVILAPLTKGGNLPFRRLCAHFGAEATFSEMAYARQLLKGSKKEYSLLRRHSSEKCYGVQFAAGDPDEAVRAASIAVQRGADFVDINCGCPIHDATRRGLGSSLLQKPEVIATMVEALAKALPVPVTVKVRTGWSEGTINVREVARIIEEAGASMITVHGRTREQRYSKSADWNLIGEVVADRAIPVVGNGDILTYYEAETRIKQSGCRSIMIGRGALVKPWLFREIKEGREWLPTIEERVEIYLRLAQYMKEHFGEDERGQRRAMDFLPWHFEFLCRYRPLPRERFEEASHNHPLLQTRYSELGEEISPIERFLRSSRNDSHRALADIFWNATSITHALDEIGTRAAALPSEPIEDTFRSNEAYYAAG